MKQGSKHKDGGLMDEELIGSDEDKLTMTTMQLQELEERLAQILTREEYVTLSPAERRILLAAMQEALPTVSSNRTIRQSTARIERDVLKEAEAINVNGKRNAPFTEEYINYTVNEFDIEG